jgi:hypothetical protein
MTDTLVDLESLEKSAIAADEYWHNDDFVTTTTVILTLIARTKNAESRAKSAEERVELLTNMQSTLEHDAYIQGRIEERTTVANLARRRAQHTGSAGETALLALAEDVERGEYIIDCHGNVETTPAPIDQPDHDLGHDAYNPYMPSPPGHGWHGPVAFLCLIAFISMIVIAVKFL